MPTSVPRRTANTITITNTKSKCPRPRDDDAPDRRRRAAAAATVTVAALLPSLLPQLRPRLQIHALTSPNAVPSIAMPVAIIAQPAASRRHHPAAADRTAVAPSAAPPPPSTIRGCSRAANSTSQPPLFSVLFNVIDESARRCSRVWIRGRRAPILPTIVPIPPPPPILLPITSSAAASFSTNLQQQFNTTNTLNVCAARALPSTTSAPPQHLSDRLRIY